MSAWLLADSITYMSMQYTLNISQIAIFQSLTESLYSLDKIRTLLSDPVGIINEIWVTNIIVHSLYY